MDDKKYQVCIYAGEDLDDITGDSEKFPPDPYQSTQEMRGRLRNNLIEEGYLEIATLH
jgi:hypothetical protein